MINTRDTCSFVRGSYCWASQVDVEVEAAELVVVVAADTMPAATSRRVAEKRILIMNVVIQVNKYRDEL